MSFLTWRWDLPQKLQRSCSFESVGRATALFSLQRLSSRGRHGQVTTRGPSAGPDVVTRPRLIPLQATVALQKTPESVDKPGMGPRSLATACLVGALLCGAAFAY